MTEAATATVSPAVNQLAYYWMTLDDATKLIFNQIYREAPEVVLRVMTQGQLQPDPAHTSLDEVVASAGDRAAFNQARVDVNAVTVSPEYPQPNEKFTVTWKRSVQGGIPDHSDAVQILDGDGAVVEERPVAQGAANDGVSDEHSMEFAQGLPVGQYAISVWANLEGGDGTGVPTAQGMRGQGSMSLYVGNTANAQIAQQQPAAHAALSGVLDARWAAEQIAGLEPDDLVGGNDAAFRKGLQDAAEALLGVGSLGDGFMEDLRRISRKLDTEINWWPERNEGTVEALVQRLGGIAQIDAAGSPGDLGFAIIQVVDDLY